MAAVVCVLSVCSIVTSDGGPTTQVYTAISRISPGSTVTEAQVRATAVPTTLVPVGAITSVSSLVDQMTSSAIPAGAILTTEDFVASSQAKTGHVIIPLQVSSHILSVIKPGDKVSIFLTDHATAEVSVARGVRVITIPSPDSSGLFSGSGTAEVILVEVPESIATKITSATTMGAANVALE
jgi:Flp pilus assembly protein CpaB